MLAIAAIIYQRQSKHEDSVSDQEKLEKILNALLKIERKNPLEGSPRAAIGYGGCLDVLVNATDILKCDTWDWDHVKPSHHDTIRSYLEFQETFVYFFQHGAAAERYISSKEVWHSLTKASQKINSRREGVGGNAPLMSLRFAHEGWQVLLGAMMSPRLVELLHQNISFAGSSTPEDDLHLILEYPLGAKCGPYEAPRANRFIVHSDENNPKVSALTPFGEALRTYNPHLLIVSGLQMMDNFPLQDEEKRGILKSISYQMQSMGPDTQIHFEMASFTEKEFLEDLIKYIIPHADSLGMNEQELPNLFSMLTYGNVSILSSSNPRVATTLDYMRRVFSMLSNSTGRPITRLHVHTLAYQAIVTKKGSSWKNTMPATAKASLTANRHVCGSSNVNLEKARLIMDDSFSTSQVQQERIWFNERKPVSCWEEGNLDFCIAPVLVCTEVHQTVGGGDNISAGGLILQV
ncbi:unnamed protein product [Darwinula stevensoni]|uniref:ADP-dependent glucokinase n=1 Tax=Darwinula stevensoni TaxID=69355 RepID=A0A7R9A1K4_9CRUS|nr:unnamed protein product [Darwinula stevensoni]CAG0886818.1 unnamed protein product [Darwinula stevensoni]